MDKKKIKDDFLMDDNEALMKDMIKKEMLKRIEKRIEENDVVFIKNIKQMLTEKENHNL